MLKKFYYWFHRKISKPEERGEYSSGLWQELVRSEALRLCRGAKGKLLEAGCGEGLFLAEVALINKDIQIYGVDNWEEILQRAEWRLKDKGIGSAALYKADATSLPFQDAYFDVVVCINVIFNLESKDIVEKVLQEIDRVCKKGGKAILDFRNSRNPFLYFKYKLAPLYDQTVRNLPLKTYSLQDMHSLLNKTGLRITRQISVGSSIKNIAPVVILEAQKL